MEEESPTLKPIIKYSKHPNILAIKNKNHRKRFNFCRVLVKDVVREVKKISLGKTAKAFDIPLKILYIKVLINLGIIFACFVNECIDDGNILFVLKYANIPPVFKKYYIGF